MGPPEMVHPTNYSGTGGALQRPQHARRLRLLHGHTGRSISIYGHCERSCAIGCIGKKGATYAAFGDYSIFTGSWYGSQRAFVVECWPQHASTEDTAMFGPGAYQPDPTAGITAMANLPPPEIVSSHR